MIIGGIDIETIPSQVLPKGCFPAFEPDNVKIGNLKDPHKIKLKLADEKKKFEESLSKKMATDSALCQVCTFVGYYYDTNTNHLVDKKVAQWPPADTEYSVVFEAWDFIKQCYESRIPLVSFAGKTFDLFVLFYRAMLQDIPVDQAMYKLLTEKWNVTKHHYDLMQILVGPYPERGKDLEFYLRLFDQGEKTIDMDGSKVYEKWLNDEHDIIREYCEDDVLSTCKLFARIEPWIILHE